jgi:hypothetical protein
MPSRPHRAHPDALVGFRTGILFDDPENGVGAALDSESGGEPEAGLPTQRVAYPLQCVAMSAGPSAIRPGECRESFRKDTASTCGINFASSEESVGH